MGGWHCCYGEVGMPVCQGGLIVVGLAQYRYSGGLYARVSRLANMLASLLCSESTITNQCV